MLNLVLDLDTGIDDAIALTIAAKDERINLLGVTCTYGNVTVDESTFNTLSLLSLLNRDDVPVYKGNDRSLLASTTYVPHEAGRKIHGKNGTGSIVLKESKREIESIGAVSFLSSLMKERDDITIITTGPMTNLATTLTNSPSLLDWKGKIIFMGGALTVIGNVNHFSEANIYKDPEAAKIIVESGLDVTMIGLDVTEKTRLYRKDAEKWKKKGSKAGKILGSMLDYYLDNTLKRMKHSSMPHLQLYVHSTPSISLPFPLTVETEGLDRGGVVVNEDRLLTKDKMVKVALDVDRYP